MYINPSHVKITHIKLILSNFSFSFTLDRSEDSDDEEVDGSYWSRALFWQQWRQNMEHHQQIQQQQQQTSNQMWNRIMNR